jgi:hypothetical protein
VGNLVQSKAFKAFPLVCYLIALVADVWLFVGGVRLMPDSVVGGIAVAFVSLILLGLVSWRITFKWKQLHSAE